MVTGSPTRSVFLGFEPPVTLPVAVPGPGDRSQPEVSLTRNAASSQWRIRAGRYVGIRPTPGAIGMDVEHARVTAAPVSEERGQPLRGSAPGGAVVEGTTAEGGTSGTVCRGRRRELRSLSRRRCGLRSGGLRYVLVLQHEVASDAHHADHDHGGHDDDRGDHGSMARGPRCR